MVVVLLGVLVLFYIGYVLVLELVCLLKDVIDQIKYGDFSVCVDLLCSDEFGVLVEGFNCMVEYLQLMYCGLEVKVVEKILQLEEKCECLEVFYDVISLVVNVISLQELVDGFI